MSARQLSGTTRVYGLIGHPVHHSRSPELHNAWFAEHHLDGVYAAFPVHPDAADAVVPAFRTLGLAGANLTIPFKEAVAGRLDGLSEFAARVGAVNTIVRDGERLIGHNTDGQGFLAGLHGAYGDVVSGADVLVLGAGGAGLSVGAAAAAAGARSVTWLNRGLSRASAACARCAVHWPHVRFAAGQLSADDFAATRADLIVSATSGAATELLASLDLSVVADNAVWADLNYWMGTPEFLAELGARGVRMQSGLPMLVHQAAAAFELFTGTKVDAASALARIV